MKELGIKLFILLFAISCQSTDNQRIIVPELTADFYAEALSDLDRKLASDADNEKLIRQKLYYCERLEWPISCLSALEYEKNRAGMTHQLADNYVYYFIKHQQFELLGDFIDEWNSQFDLYEKNQKSFIYGLTYSRQFGRAQTHLRDYLSKHTDTSALAFASQQYLEMQDTILAVYCLANLYADAPEHPLMYQYGNILFKLNEHERAFQAMEHYRVNHSISYEDAFGIAMTYSSKGYLKPAIGILKPYCCQDTVSFFISDMHKRSFEFDSSVMYLDSVIIADPKNLRALWKKSRAFEDKGWFSYALSLLEDITEIDTNHQEAQKRIDLIQRKIAYLQRQKREDLIPPALELKPIKFDN